MYSYRNAIKSRLARNAMCVGCSAHRKGYIKVERAYIDGKRYVFLVKIDK